MKRHAFACFLFVLSIVGWVPRTGRAQDPADILGHYRILPRLSVLRETGGIAGIDRRYRLIGKYDLRRQAIPWTGKASFENAEIWGSQISDGPVPAVVLDVDAVLNLEGLRGEALPVAAPFDVYRFTGNSADGSSVDLLGAIIGPWMYLRGETQPPAGTADFFSYRIQAVARSRPFADFNDDGIVDAADYVMLRDSSANVDAMGIAAGPHDIRAGAGYAEWAEQFGEVVPDVGFLDAMMSTAAGDAGGGVGVPEPTAIGILLAGGIALARFRRSN